MTDRTDTRHTRRGELNELGLPRLTVVASNLEEQELLYSLEESGRELRIAQAKERTARKDAARREQQLLAVLARVVAGVMYGAADPLSEGIDVLEAAGVILPGPAEDEPADHFEDYGVAA